MTNSKSDEKQKSVCVITNGCTEGRMDSALVERFFQERSDFQPCTDCMKADLIVFLGCCATQDKENLSRQIIESLRLKKRSDAHILVVGCISKLQPELQSKDSQFKDLVDQINGMSNFEGRQDFAVNLPHSEFWQIGKDVFGPSIATNIIREYCHRDYGNLLLRTFPKLDANITRLIVKYRRLIDKEILPAHSKTYCIKVSTGCMGNCSYCSIKLARGRIKSKRLYAVVREFEWGLNQGYDDFTLLGTDIGDYGKDLGTDLLDLLERLVAHEEKFILRLRNVNPRWLIPSVSHFCELLKTGKIRYILSPVESGSNRILERMNRGYRVEDYVEAIRKIRKAWPRIFIKNQIMVGFPGETNADFNKTEELLKLGLFDYTDVCAFTKRPKTKAWNLPDQVLDKIIAKRYRRLRFKSFVHLPLKRWLSICTLKRR